MFSGEQEWGPNGGFLELFISGPLTFTVKEPFLLLVDWLLCPLKQARHLSLSLAQGIVLPFRVPHGKRVRLLGARAHGPCLTFAPSHSKVIWFSEGLMLGAAIIEGPWFRPSLETFSGKPKKEEEVLVCAPGRAKCGHSL